MRSGQPGRSKQEPPVADGGLWLQATEAYSSYLKGKGSLRRHGVAFKIIKSTEDPGSPQTRTRAARGIPVA